MFKWIRILFGRKESKVLSVNNLRIESEAPIESNPGTDNTRSITRDIKTVGYRHKLPRGSSKKRKGSKNVKRRIK